MNAVDVNTAVDVILIGILAAVWLAAGLLADGMSAVVSARQLRRRAGLLSALVTSGVAVFAAVPLVSELVPGLSAAPTAALLPAVPAFVVLTATVRRLGWVRRGSGAFATAPLTPVPPALRAASAHPMLAAPLQITGLAALAGLPIAAGVVTLPGGQATAVVGIAVIMAVLTVAVIGIRAGLRHSRLAPLVLAPLDRDREKIPAGVR